MLYLPQLLQEVRRLEFEIDLVEETGLGRYSRGFAQLAFDDSAPSYQYDHVPTEAANNVPETIVKSARYPRVAVLLGVNQQYHVPLLICRSSAVLFVFTWASQACLLISSLVSENGRKEPTISTLDYRLRIAQILLAFLWVCLAKETLLRVLMLLTRYQAAEAAYLSHIFASSLMSRWLRHYSPTAVLVRLISLSIFLAYTCTLVFRLTGALESSLESLSRGLPVWISVCVCLLVGYFSTQQDMSIEKDRDDRRRRLVLRLKCLYTTAACSLLSLLVLVCIIHVGNRSTGEIIRSLREIYILKANLLFDTLEREL